MKNLGLDVGFGFTKAVFGARRIKFPSVVGSYDEPAFQDAGLDTSGNDHGKITVDGQVFLVGDDAVRRSVRVFTSRERNWIDTPAYKALVRHALVLMKRQYGEPCRIITGLPVAHYKKCREKLTNTIKGITGPNTEVKVILQPLGSYFDRLLDDDAIVKDKDLLQSAVGVIDIGFFTVDFVTVRNLQFVKDSHESYEGGMATAYRRIARTIYEYYDCKKEVYEVEDTVRNGCITAYGERKDVRSIVDQNLKTLAAEIRARATTLWKEGADIDAILLTGGGAGVLKDYLNFYKHIRMVDDSQFANARGFYKYGRRLEYDV